MMGLESSLLNFIFYISFLKRKKIPRFSEELIISLRFAFQNVSWGILKMPDIKINYLLIYLRMCEASHS